MKIRTLTAIILGFSLFLTSDVSAKGISSAKCSFADGNNQFFNNGKLTYSIERTKELMELSFDRLDAPDGKARLIGNNGSADVNVSMGTHTLNIIEITPSGNWNVLTILTNDITHGAKLQAVYSRHVTTGFALVPSQRVGYCQIFTM